MKDNSIQSQTIEWLRFFCIGVVVLLHSANSPTHNYSSLSYRYGAYDTIQILFSEGLCRVAVPVLFLISGYLFFIKLEDWNTSVWIGKIKKRGRTLLLPYILWNIIPIVLSLAKLYTISILPGGTSPNVMAWYNSIGNFRSLWDMGNGYPINYPMWFIRDLIVFIILSPIIFYYIKKTGVVGLIIFYAVYFFNIWGSVPGLSEEGLFFFSLGAFFSIKGIDFTVLFKNYWIIALCISVPLVISMVLTFGNIPAVWMYTRRVFTLTGASCTIGIVALLIQKDRITVHQLLSNSSFFIYATHGTIMLPIMQFALGKILPFNQLGLIIRYLLAPIATIVLLILCFFLLSKWMPKTTAVLTGGRSY